MSDHGLLRGARRITAYLNEKYGPDWKEDDVYYGKRTGKLPIGKYGKELIASPSKLDRAISELVEARPDTAALTQLLGTNRR
jgi:hypothetical protein